MASLAGRARRVARSCAVLARALAHPRTPWYARAVGALTLLYALSPIDLIPDFIPILGQLDDLVLVPLGVRAAVRMIPRDVWEECDAATPAGAGLARDWRGAALVVLVWLALLAAGIAVLRRIV